MVFVVNNTMKLSSQQSDCKSESHQQQPNSKQNIPKSPSFHSGLDLVANNKFVNNISKFNFTSSSSSSASTSAAEEEQHYLDSKEDNINSLYAMNGNNNNNNKTSAGGGGAPDQQSLFSFTKFFTNSNPLNNLNITGNLSLNRQPQQQQPQQQQQPPLPPPQLQHQQQQQIQSNQINGDYYKYNNNMNKPMQMPPTNVSNATLQSSYTSVANFVARKQKEQQQSYQQQYQQSQQQLSQQQQVQGSPNRARDRNLFDKMPSPLDVQPLPLLKGVCFYSNKYSLFSCFFFMILM